MLEDSFKFIDYETGFLIGLAGLVVAAISFIDDLLDLPAWFRFVALIICSGVFISISGINLTSLGDLLGFGEIKLNGIAGPLFTIFCVVGVANAFNWIDGLDGLFSTQALIAIAVTFYFISGNGLFLILFLIAFLPYLLMNLSVFAGKKSRLYWRSWGNGNWIRDWLVFSKRRRKRVDKSNDWALDNCFGFIKCLQGNV